MLEQIPGRSRGKVRAPEIIRMVEVDEVVLGQDVGHPIARIVWILDGVLAVLPALLGAVLPPLPEHAGERILAPRIDVRIAGDDLRGDPRVFHEDVLRRDRAVPHRPELVHVRGLALFTALDDALAAVIVDERRRPAVVADVMDPVLLIPHDGPPLATREVVPSGLVAVRVKGIGAITDRRRLVRAKSGVCVGEIVRRLLLRHRRPSGRRDVVRLGLSRDVVDRVVRERQRIVIALVRTEAPFASRMGQPIEAVIDKRLIDRPTEVLGCGDGDLVRERRDVADEVVAVMQILEVAGGEAREPPVERVVRIGRFGPIAHSKERTLTELIVLEPLHVGRRDPELHAGDRVHEAAGIVGVGQHLAIRVRHLLEAAPGIVEVVGCPDLGGVVAIALRMARDGLGLLAEVA